MEDGLYLAASGMMLESRRQEASAQNLAASGLPGYKRDFLVSSSFKDMLDGQAGASKTGNLLGSDGGKLHYDFSNGVLKKTDRRLDFAFDSYTRESKDPTVKDAQLFFQVQSPDGKTLLTKNGCFQVNSDRMLVTADGMKVMNESGSPITFGADDNLGNVFVSSDGQVKVEDTSTSPTVIKTLSNIQLALVKSPQSLTRFSANYFMDADGSADVTPATAETFNMKNGYYEDSNSSPIQEMNAMIQSVREYEFHSKVVKSIQDTYRQELSKLGA